MEAIKIKLCIEAIVRWEQMTHRSFRTMDFADEGDNMRLIYCSYIVGQDNPPSYKEFEYLLTQKRFRSKFTQAMTRYNNFLSQFTAQRMTEGAGVEQNEDMTIGSIAARLIVSGGIDAQYVMREMSIEDMPIYIEALNDKIKREEESRRMWTYFNILPHIDSKKLKSPEKLVVFSWELERIQEEAKKIAEDSRAEFEAFMRGEDTIKTE